MMMPGAAAGRTRIQFIGAASAQAATVTIPSHRNGDFLFFIAFNEGSINVPVWGDFFADGWIPLAADADGNGNAYLAGIQFSDGTVTFPGTISNCNLVVVGVWRNVDQANPIGGNAFGIRSDGDADWECDSTDVEFPGHTVSVGVAVGTTNSYDPSGLGRTSNPTHTVRHTGSYSNRWALVVDAVDQPLDLTFAAERVAGSGGDTICLEFCLNPIGST